jgi:hypothetical protein
MDAQEKLRRMTSRTLAALFLIVAVTAGVSAQHAAPAVDERSGSFSRRRRAIWC